MLDTAPAHGMGRVCLLLAVCKWCSGGGVTVGLSSILAAWASSFVCPPSIARASGTLPGLLRLAQFLESSRDFVVQFVLAAFVYFARCLS